MKRNMDLIRDILIEIEQKQEGGNINNIQISLNGRPDGEVTEHLFMLREAGYIEIFDFSTTTGQCARVRRMTWQGYEFLGLVRDEDVWKNTKSGAAKVGSFSLDVLKAVATEILKNRISALFI